MTRVRRRKAILTACFVDRKLGEQTVAQLTDLMEPYARAARLIIHCENLAAMCIEQLEAFVGGIHHLTGVSIEASHLHRMSDGQFKVLDEAFSRVTAVSLRDSLLGMATAEQRLALVKLFPAAITVDLRYNNFEKMTAEELLQFLGGFTQAREINLNNCSISAGVIDALINLRNQDSTLLTRLTGLDHQQDEVNQLVDARIDRVMQQLKHVRLLVASIRPGPPYITQKTLAMARLFVQRPYSQREKAERSWSNLVSYHNGLLASASAKESQAESEEPVGQLGGGSK